MAASGPKAHQGSIPQPVDPLAAAEGIVSIDITEKFSLAAGMLSPGELVKDGFFTLFESVGALEIMDPKMDSGCLEANESIDHTYDVSRPLLPEEVLGIVDQLLCHEMAWHLGYPLSQTLFTSVYIDAILMPCPKNISEADFKRDHPADEPQDPMLFALRAYCLGLVKACGYVCSRIKNEHFYEEEDFVTNTYNRSLLEEVEIEPIQEVIEAARTSIKQLTGQGISADVLSALDLRLSLRLAFLDGIKVSHRSRDIDALRKTWKSGFDILNVVKKTHPLGKTVSDAFSAKLQRKLASTMPPRPIVQLSFEDAFGHLVRLFSDAMEIVGVLNYTDSQCLQTFVMSFQAKKPQPLVFVRTMFQTYLFSDMVVVGSQSIRQVLDKDMSITVLPCAPQLDRANDDVEVIHDPRWTIAHHMEQFRQRAAQPFLDVLRTFCQNRCRVRRTLCHTIQDWENLQAEAEEVDQIVQTQAGEQPLLFNAGHQQTIESFQLPLSSWAYYYKLRQMEWIVQLGFELEVYQVDELAGMYWYLNYLAKTRVGHIERIKSFLMRSINQAQAQTQTQKRGGGLSRDVETQFSTSLAFIKLALLDAAATWELSDALSCLFVVLFRLDLLVPPPRPYGGDILRYELRTRPFSSIGLPVLPTYEEFSRGTYQPETPTHDLLLYAEKAVAGARKGFDHMSKLPEAEAFSAGGSHTRWVTGMRNCVKACIATGIAVSSVKKALEAAEAAGVQEGTGKGLKEVMKIKVEVPPPEKAYHEWWITPKILPVR